MKVSNTIVWTIFVVSSCLILTTRCKSNLQEDGICFEHRKRIGCCSHFELKKNTCTQCLTGYDSTINSTCKPCTNGKYGKKCGNMCTCKSNEKCNHIFGCITVDPGTSEKNGKSKRKPPDTYTESNNSDVVTYMTCVAVGSVLIVVCGLIVKNREAICRHKSGNNAVKHLIHKLKQPTVHDGHNKKVAESLYDEINEKYMINFDGE